MIVDNLDRIAPAVERALGDVEVRILRVRDYGTARRMSVQAAPDLILGMMSLSNGNNEGLSFCRDLQAHPELCKVAVLLFSLELREDEIHTAAESGARGLMHWPQDLEALSKRILSILPGIVRKQQSPDPPVPTKTPSPEQSVSPDPEMQEKISAAQKLLAQVLHNLKTSDLLEVVSLEDVPRVVSEMCRSVCGISPQISEKTSEEKPAVSDSDSEKDVMSDLERAFRVKD